MADAWDPATGRSIAASDIQDLLAAATARSQNISELTQLGEEVMSQDHDVRSYTEETAVLHGPDVLFIKLLDGAGAAIGQFLSRDKHESASRVCTFLERVPPNGRVTIDCGSWSAIALRHPNGTSVQTSYMERTCAHTPAALSYSFEAIPQWALGICSMFLLTHELNVKANTIMEMGRQRQRDQAQHLAGQPTDLATSMHGCHANAMFA